MNKAERSKELRYKRPALASMGFDAMVSELWEIQDACSDVEYFIERDDGTLLNALCGDEDDECEFKFAFADLSAKADRLIAAIQSQVVRDEYDDYTVALLGNRYGVVGFDFVEEDYYSLCGYDANLATDGAGKRIMRHTKAEIIASVGQCLGVLISFLDLRQQYDYLKATMDILRDENTSILQTIKQIDDLYKRMTDQGATWEENRRAERDFDKLLESLPDRVWIE